jgi:hypothetical protein
MGSRTVSLATLGRRHRQDKASRQEVGADPHKGNHDMGEGSGLQIEECFTGRTYPNLRLSHKTSRLLLAKPNPSSNEWLCQVLLLSMC